MSLLRDGPPINMRWIKLFRHSREALIFSILVVMLLVSLQGLVAVHRIEASNRQLVEQSLPLFEVIQTVRNRLNRQEKLFHQYYLDGQMQTFTAAVTAATAQTRQDLEKMTVVLGPVPAVEKMDAAVIQLNQIAERFDQAMLAPTDWDKAREVLADFTPVAAKIDKLSHALLARVNTSVRDNADLSLSETENGLLWIGSMSFVLFVAAVILLGINRSLNLALVEQRRMAGFPEHNPDPVMALNKQGDIIYANPGTRKLIKNRFQSASLEKFLPDTISQLMLKAREKETVVRVEQELASSVYAIELHWLKDLAEYHLYLSDVSEQKRAQEKLTYMAYHNVLTGLPNRQELERIFSRHPPCYLLLFEIDDFQQVITSSGHAVAESLIRAFVQRLGTFYATGKDGVFQIDSNLFVLLPVSVSDIAVNRFDGNSFGC